MKYLGLIVDNKLNWDLHVNELKKKLNRTIAILYKVKSQVLINPLCVLCLISLIFELWLKCMGSR